VVQLEVDFKVESLVNNRVGILVVNYYNEGFARSIDETGACEFIAAQLSGIMGSLGLQDLAEQFLLGVIGEDGFTRLPLKLFAAVVQVPIELLLKEDDEALQPSDAVVLLLDQRIAQDAVELDAQLALLFTHRIQLVTDHLAAIILIRYRR